MKTTVSLNTTGIDRYKANLGKVTKIVGKAAADVEATAKSSITNKSRRYKKYAKGHWSSAPGMPPNSDTGYLANSIMHRMLTPVSAEVSAMAKYAVPLEFGWTQKGGNTVPARPFMNPALEKVKPRFIKALTVVLKGK
jgi:phage gpG-like protein